MRSTDTDEPVSGHRLPLLYNMVYCSRAAAGIGDADVNRIVESARRWNPVFGITGLLVFGSGVFFQWLEGPRENVLHLMSLLKADPRHESVVPLSESEEVRERLFPDWDMERVQAEDIRVVLQDALDSAHDLHNVRSLSVLLHQLEESPLSQLGQA